MIEEELEKAFEKQIKKLCKIADKMSLKFQFSVDSVTKLIQTKYPELTANYSESDGGIIFVNDSDMGEYYNLDQIYQTFGRR